MRWPYVLCLQPGSIVQLNEVSLLCYWDRWIRSLTYEQCEKKWGKCNLLSGHSQVIFPEIVSAPIYILRWTPRLGFMSCSTGGYSTARLPIPQKTRLTHENQRKFFSQNLLKQQRRQHEPSTRDPTPLSTPIMVFMKKRHYVPEALAVEDST